MNKEFQFLIYNTPQENVKIDVVIKDETVWLTQKAMATLFGAERSVITKHLGNIFQEGELNENSVCAKIAHTVADGKKYNTQFNNLDAIISVGYHVAIYSNKPNIISSITLGKCAYSNSPTFLATSVA